MEQEVLNYHWKTGRRRLYDSDVEMYFKILDYIENNQLTVEKKPDRKGVVTEYKKPMSWLRLLHHLGLQRTTAKPYISGQYDDGSNDFSALLAWAREVVESDLEIGATEGIYNDRMVQANLTAHYGWNVERKLAISTTVTMTTSEATNKLLSLISEVSGLIGVQDND